MTDDAEMDVPSVPSQLYLMTNEADGGKTQGFSTPVGDKHLVMYWVNGRKQPMPLENIFEKQCAAIVFRCEAKKLVFIPYEVHLIKQKMLSDERDDALKSLDDVVVKKSFKHEVEKTKIYKEVTAMRKERDAALDNAAKEIKIGLQVMTDQRDKAISDRDAAIARHNQAVEFREIQLRELREENVTLTNRIAELERQLRRSSRGSTEEPSAKKQKLDG